MSSFISLADGDVNRGPELLAFSIIGTAIALISCIMRIFVRLKLTHCIGRDDYVILAAMLFAMIGLSLNIPEAVAGEGRHEFYLTQDQIIEATKLRAIAQPWQNTSICFSKISICLFLLRVIEQHKRSWKWFLYIQIAALFAISSVLSIVIVLQCQPINKLWDLEVTGTCWTAYTQEVVECLQTVFSALSDFTLAAAPFLILKDIKMNQKTKAVLGLILCLGVSAGICAIVRTCELAALAESRDLTFASVNSSICMVSEQNLALLAANIPPLGSIFSRVLRKVGFKSQEEDIEYNEHRFSVLGLQDNSIPSTPELSTSIFGNRSKTTGSTNSEAESVVFPIQGALKAEKLGKMINSLRDFDNGLYKMNRV